MGTRDNGFLKVTGTLMVLGGAFGIIAAIIAIAGVGLLAALAADAEAAIGGLTFASVLVLVSAILQLVTGIIGVRSAARPDKAQICIVLGFLVAGLSVVGNIWSSCATASITSEAFKLNISGLVTGLLLPALFLTGAFQNKRRA